MTLTRLLEDFGPATRAPVTADERDIAREDQRLAIFEQGYSAGWEDALSAQTGQDRRATEAFASALEDLSFPYQEALAQMIANTAPVIEAILHQIVPGQIADHLARIVWDEVEALLRDPAQNPVEIVAAPARIAFLEKAMPQGIDATIRADGSLDDDCVRLRVGPAERQIDMSHIARRLDGAIAAFRHQTESGKTHG